MAARTLAQAQLNRGFESAVTLAAASLLPPMTATTLDAAQLSHAFKSATTLDVASLLPHMAAPKVVITT